MIRPGVASLARVMTSNNGACLSIADGTGRDGFRANGRTGVTQRGCDITAASL
jgi:hypothetical protein